MNYALIISTNLTTMYDEAILFARRSLFKNKKKKINRISLIRIFENYSRKEFEKKKWNDKMFIRFIVSRLQLLQNR